MLEGIFKGLLQWIYALVIEMAEYMADGLLDVFAMDLAYFETAIPVTGDILAVVTAAGWALLLGNLVFQAAKSMMAGLGFESEDPKELFARTFVFSFLLLASRQICDIGLGISGAVIAMLRIPSGVSGLFAVFPGEDAFSIGASWLLVIIVGVVLVWQIVRLFFEIGERYFLVGFLTVTAPLAFAMGGSKSTADIFKGWARMYASMCLMMVLNVVFLKMLLSAMGAAPSGAAVFPWMILVVAVARVARKIDGIVARIGLNPAITGDGLGRGLPGMLSYMVIRSVVSNVTRNAGKGAAGKSGSGATGGSPPPSPSSGGNGAAFASGGSGNGATGRSGASQRPRGSAQASASSGGNEAGARTEVPAGSGARAADPSVANGHPTRDRAQGPAPAGNAPGNAPGANSGARAAGPDTVSAAPDPGGHTPRGHSGPDPGHGANGNRDSAHGAPENARPRRQNADKGGENGSARTSALYGPNGGNGAPRTPETAGIASVAGVSGASGRSGAPAPEVDTGSGRRADTRGRTFSSAGNGETGDGRQARAQSRRTSVTPGFVGTQSVLGENRPKGMRPQAAGVADPKDTDERQSHFRTNAVSGIPDKKGRSARAGGVGDAADTAVRGAAPGPGRATARKSALVDSTKAGGSGQSGTSAHGFTERGIPGTLGTPDMAGTPATKAHREAAGRESRAASPGERTGEIPRTGTADAAGRIRRGGVPARPETAYPQTRTGYGEGISPPNTPGPTPRGEAPARREPAAPNITGNVSSAHPAERPAAPPGKPGPAATDIPPNEPFGRGGSGRGVSGSATEKRGNAKTRRGKGGKKE